MASASPLPISLPIEDIKVYIAIEPIETPVATAKGGQLVRNAGFPNEYVLQNPDRKEKLHSGVTYQIRFKELGKASSVLARFTRSTASTVTFTQDGE